MLEYNKPTPQSDGISRPFWEGCRRHTLLVQQCSACNKYRFPPMYLCPYCGARASTWKQVSGKGTVSSFSVVHRAFHPAFAADIPYVVIRVALNEQERLEILSNIVDCTYGQVYVGMPVEVIFDDVDEETTLPKFRPMA